MEIYAVHKPDNVHKVDYLLEKLRPYDLEKLLTERFEY